MENVIKAFLGVFFLVLLSITGMGILSASIDSRAAEDAMSRYCESIESSCFDPKVIKACCDDAAASSRTLKVEVRSRAGEEIPSYGWAILTYDYKVPALGLCRKTVIRSDLR